MFFSLKCRQVLFLIFYFNFTSLMILNAETYENPNSFEQEKITLDFETALQRAYTYAPSMINASLEIGIQEAETEQAGLFPNPLFSIEYDRFGGSSEVDKTDPPEITYAISQLIELGGKRKARRNFASQLEAIAEKNQEIVMADLRLNIVNAFVDTYAAQEKCKIALQQKIANENVLKSIVAKVEAGKASLAQQYKAEIALIRSVHSLEHIDRAFSVARQNLVTYWGSSCVDFEEVSYPFYEIETPPCFCDLSAAIFDNPDFLKSELEIDAAERNFYLQRTERIPDIEVSAGIVNIRDKDNDTAGVFEIEIPIPIFDRNQGLIRRSEYEICLAENKYNALQMEIEAELKMIYQELLCEYNEANTIRDQILKKANEVYSNIFEGYNQGKFELLELIDAQQILFNIQNEYIDALVEYHQQIAKIERLIGKID